MRPRSGPAPPSGSASTIDRPRYPDSGPITTIGCINPQWRGGAGMKSVSIVSVLGVLGLAAAGTSAGVAASETDQGPAPAATQAEGPDDDRRDAPTDLTRPRPDGRRRPRAQMA